MLLVAELRPLESSPTPIVHVATVSTGESDRIDGLNSTYFFLLLLKLFPPLFALASRKLYMASLAAWEGIMWHNNRLGTID